MVLRSFEDRLERLVEGVFSRAFKSGLQPVEIGRRLVREMEASRTVDANGPPPGPQPLRHPGLPRGRGSAWLQVHDSLVDELTATVRSYATQQRLSFLGRISVEFQTDQSLRVGLFRLHPSYDERVANSEPGGWLEGPNGVHYRLKQRGDGDRSAVDRRHRRRRPERLPPARRAAHPVGDSFQLVDLGSTNGCRVNGTRVTSHVLSDGDEIALGPVRLIYRRA